MFGTLFYLNGVIEMRLKYRTVVTAALVFVCAAAVILILRIQRGAWNFENSENFAVGAAPVLAESAELIVPESVADTAQPAASEPAVTAAEPAASAPAATPELSYETGGELLNCNFYEEREFYTFVSNAESYDIDGKMFSATVPHHLLAGDIIASLFKTAADTRPNIETVVIIAPIHEPKDYALRTTLSDWAAPWGVLRCDKGFSERFISELDAIPDNDTITSDHSAAALIPFAQYYLPEASCAVILVPQFASLTDMERLAALLAEFAAEKECLFVFSVDFSHYLDPAQTAMRDIETREAVLGNDIPRIALMTDANMDSPKNMCAFLLTNELLGSVTRELDHSNSLEISGIPPEHPSFDEGLTSYFIFAGIG